jgi:hypothetical protein
VFPTSQDAQSRFAGPQQRVQSAAEFSSLVLEKTGLEPRQDVQADFPIAATFRALYVFVAIEIGSRRIRHVNVTDHPTAEWAIQRFREFLAY